MMVIRIVLFFILCLFSVVQANECRSVFTEERASYFSTQLSANEFTVNRNLIHYEDTFSSKVLGLSFKQVLTSLPKKSTWIDMGTGKAYAILEGLYENPHIKGVGIAYKKPNHRDFIKVIEGLVGQRFQYLEGEYVENMMSLGLLDKWKGKVKLITDVYGPLSYADNVSRIMQIYLDLVSKNGQLFFHISEHKTTLVKSGSVRTFTLIDWFKSIKGIEVKVLNSHEGIYEKTGEEVKVVSLQIIKTTKDVEVPQNLFLQSNEYGTPSRREYIWN